VLLNRPIATKIARTLAAVAIVCAMVALEFQMKGLRNTTVTYLLLLAILWFAVKWDRMETITASVVAALGFEMFFQPPVGSLKMKDPQAWVAVGAFLATSIIMSQVALKSRRRAVEALERKRETERLYELGQAMLSCDSLQTTAWVAINQTIPIFGAKGAGFYLKASGDPHWAGTGAEALPEDLLRRVSNEGVLYRDRAAGLVILPVRVGEEIAGSFGIHGAPVSDAVLKSIGSLLSAVLERVRASDRLLEANRELERKHEEVERQKKTSETLLLNILPAEVADELRTKGMVSPKYFEDVTILFTDFVGFTLATEKLAAEDLVEMLDDYFTAFDRIVARYGLEKMKTIGDSYMCLSGLPVRNPAHPVDMVMAAFEMLREVQERGARASRAHWQVRIGIHTGPVIAGVVGINKFAFDIWGDTVNYSSRMESSGQADRINVSERTYSRIKDFFECEYRGKVLTKEKRELDMYFVNGVLPALLGGAGELPPPIFSRRYHVYFQKDPPAFPAFLAPAARAQTAGPL
jgi:class 3 adenylate cyclase